MQKGLKIFLILCLTVFLTTLLITNNSHPTSPIFFGVKRLEEKAFYSLKMSPSSKADYLSTLLDDRLADLKDEVDSKSYAQILSSSLRYSSTVGDLTNLIVDNNLKDKVSDLTTKLTAQKQSLQQLYEIYPKNDKDNVEWKYIQDDMNYLDLYIKRLADLK